MKKRILGLVVMSIMTLSSLPAFAGVATEGGTWDYGVSSNVWSTYNHPKEIHGSSVRNGDGQTDYDYNEPATTPAESSIYATKHNNKAYYNKGYRDPKSRQALVDMPQHEVSLDQ